MTIQLFLVEDDHEFGQSLLGLIQANPLFQFCGWANTLEQARRDIDAGAADVYLVDMGLPDGSGLDVIQHLARTRPQAKVLVLSTLGDSRHILSSLEQGAHGYLLKSDAPQFIINSIITLVNEGGVLSGHASKVVIQRMAQGGATAQEKPSPADPQSPLTPKEQIVLQHVQRGLPAKGVAAQLCISIFTVNQHLRSIYRKLHARNKMEAVQAARKQGIL